MKTKTNEKKMKKKKEYYSAFHCGLAQ